jgi:hypothetical protein
VVVASSQSNCQTLCSTGSKGLVESAERLRKLIVGLIEKLREIHQYTITLPRYGILAGDGHLFDDDDLIPICGSAAVATTLIRVTTGHSAAMRGAVQNASRGGPAHDKDLAYLLRFPAVRAALRWAG